jgi:HAD superfamily hydrolase (TIGR01509 family)
MDGTLVDSLSVLTGVYFAFLEQYGYTGSFAEFNQLNGPSLPEVVAYLKQQYHLSGSHTDLLLQYRACLEDQFATLAQPNPGAVTLLEFLQHQGLRTGLVTAAGSRIVYPFLEAQGWTGYFEHIITADGIAQAKPHPAIYQKALACFELHNTQGVLAVEDSQNGIQSALSAGIPVVWLRSRLETLSSITGLAGTIERLDDLIPLLQAECPLR